MNPASERSGSRRAIVIAVQLAGFAACMYLVYWFASGQLAKPEYRRQLDRLRDAPLWMPLACVALTAATVALNGLVFWATARPVAAARRLPASDMVALNAVCTLLLYLPLKASLLFRAFFHARRDALPLVQVLSYLLATGVVIAAGLAGPVLASIWRGRLDALWWLTAIGATLGLAAAVVAAARWATRRFAAVVDGRGANLVTGLRILADARAVALSIVLRTIDLAVHAARFHVAAMAAGVDLPWEQSVLAGATYFLIQVAAPTGAGGVREVGTLGVLSFLSSVNLGAIIAAVSVIDLGTNILMGLAGAAWLRVDRLFAKEPRP